MKEIIDFLIEVNKLKDLPRTGLVTWGVKSPGTVADHIFRAAFTFWLLGRKKNLKIERAIKFALFHDLCEVYAGDLTPLMYYMRRTKRIMKGIRLSNKEKQKRSKKKFQIEKKSLLKLIRFIKPELKKEVFAYWLNYEKGISREVKLIREFDRIDALLESLEYIGTDKKITGTAWWEIVEEIVEDHLVKEFLETMQKKFYGKAQKNHKRQKELESILDFLLQVGKLKSTERLYWELRGVKSPETVSGHIYTLTLAAWLLASGRKELRMEKLLKMALCHELSAVYTGDTTPYDRILQENSVADKKEILKRMLRLSKKEKRSIFLKDYREEKKSLEKLALNLEPQLKREILQLWKEYRTKSSPEGRFLSQLNVAVVLLQGLIYEKKYKKFSAAPLWEWAFEISDDPLILEFLEEMKKKFY